MGNVLSEEKKKQVIALGQLGWTLRRIQRETGIRRETAAAYLKAAGVPIACPGRPQTSTPTKPAIMVTTDSAEAKPAISVITEQPTKAEPAAGEPTPSRSPSASACEPFRELIESGLARGRNAMGIWQDLVEQSAFPGGYQSVRRYVRKLRGTPVPEPCAVIVIAPGEDYGESGVMLSVTSPAARARRREAYFGRLELSITRLLKIA